MSDAKPTPPRELDVYADEFGDWDAFAKGERSGKYLRSSPLFSAIEATPETLHASEAFDLIERLASPGVRGFLTLIDQQAVDGLLEKTRGERQRFLAPPIECKVESSPAADLLAAQAEIERLRGELRAAKTLDAILGENAETLAIEDERDEALDVVGALMSLIDDGELVRNTDDDADTMKFLSQGARIVHTLKAAQDLLAKHAATAQKREGG